MGILIRIACLAVLWAGVVQASGFDWAARVEIEERIAFGATQAQ